MEFDKWLKHRMEERNMSREDLAAKSGVTEQSIKCYLTGTRMPTLRVFLEILNALDMEMILKERGQDRI